MNKAQETANIMKTNYRSAPVTDLDPSLVSIAAGDSRSRAISQKGKKRTKVRGVDLAFLLAAFLGSCVTTELRAQVIVVPNSLATNDGNGSATSTEGPASVRWLQIHDASQFGALTGAILPHPIRLSPRQDSRPIRPALVDSADLRLDDEPLRRRAEHDLRREPRHKQHARV